MEIRIAAQAVERLDEYALVPIRFRVSSRLNLDRLWLGEFDEIRIPPYEKDYDALEPIASLMERFDTSNWRMFTAVIAPDPHPESDPRILHLATKDSVLGGAIVAWNTPRVDMLEGREDLAIVWDIRVRPEYQGLGAGRQLFDAAKAWAREQKCTELRVETQDVNVGACRFYSAVGCRVHSIQLGAYEGLDEAKVIFNTKC